MTVSWRRSARGRGAPSGAAAPSDAPQRPQKAKPGGLGAPQAGQPDPRSLPHSGQVAEPGALSAEQRGQRISLSSGSRRAGYHRAAAPLRKAIATWPPQPSSQSAEAPRWIPTQAACQPAVTVVWSR